VPYVHLQDKTPAAQLVVAGDDGMAAVSKVVAAAALNGVHLDGAAERYTTITLPDGMGEAVSVLLRRCDTRLWQRQLMSFKCEYKIYLNININTRLHINMNIRTRSHVYTHMHISICTYVWRTHT
jgi:hypothetical protein